MILKSTLKRLETQQHYDSHLNHICMYGALAPYLLFLHTNAVEPSGLSLDTDPWRECWVSESPYSVPSFVSADRFSQASLFTTDGADGDVILAATDGSRIACQSFTPEMPKSAATSKLCSARAIASKILKTGIPFLRPFGRVCLAWGAS